MRRLLRPAAVAAVAVLLSAPPAASTPAGRAVEGRSGARLLPPAGAVVRDYENAGYRLRVVDGVVEVDVELSSLGSKWPFELPARRGHDPLERLATGVASGAKDRFTAVSRILSWVARNIEYELDRTQPQTPKAVLGRRSAYCTGIARLTVALLGRLGIEAREVEGYVVEPQSRDAGYHRWIEVLYPDRGWVFSDPLATHHYVEPTYVRLASDRVRREPGASGQVIARWGALEVVDIFPAGAPGVPARRNDDRSLAATVRIEVEPTEEGRVVLEGRAARRTRALLDGATSFVGLGPGRYRVHLFLEGRDPFERGVELSGHGRWLVSIPLPERAARSTGGGHAAARFSDRTAVPRSIIGRSSR